MGLSKAINRKFIDLGSPQKNRQVRPQLGGKNLLVTNFGDLKKGSNQQIIHIMQR